METAGSEIVLEILSYFRILPYLRTAPRKDEQDDSIQLTCIGYLLYTKQEKNVRCLLEAHIPDSGLKPPLNRRNPN